MNKKTKRPYHKIKQEIRDQIIHEYFKNKLSFMEVLFIFEFIPIILDFLTFKN